jgi:tRNA(Ile2) C34 agmatinyltransferase TiaS
MELYLAIDDTDNDHSIGTGRLARMLADDLVETGLLIEPSVTRHQFLVHSDIPYTSHNSCACVAAEAAGGEVRNVFDQAMQFLVTNYHEGANPGLCVAAREEVPSELSWFGYLAQNVVIPIEEARKLADRLGVLVWWKGETGQGFIGAMAGVGLRRTGNDGRFIGMKGIRDLKGMLSVGEITAKSEISMVASTEGETLAECEMIDTGDWVRPSLREGCPVLIVQRRGEVWCPAERRKKTD